MPNLHSLVLHALNPLAKLALLIPLFLILIACNNAPQEKQGYVSGNAVKGLITNGIVSAYKIQTTETPSTRILLGQARTNDLGEYNLPIPELDNNALVVLELTTDSQSTMVCDLVEGCLHSSNQLFSQFGEQLPLPEHFKLLGYLSVENQTSYLSPLSHITIVTADALQGGLSAQNIQTASKWVAQTFDLKSNLFDIKTPDLTNLAQFTDLSDQQLKQGILNAAFYALSMTKEWSDEKIDLDSLPLKEIFRDAALLAQALSEQIEQEQSSYASSLASISADAQTRYEDLSNLELTIPNHPSSISINENQSFSLHVQANGEGPIAYQWQKDDQIIPNANSASYGIANASTSDSGSYNVIVSNATESRTSLYALVLVNKVIKPILITQQPQAQNLTAGDSLSLSVIVTGDGPIDYQWQKEGSLLPGETNSTLSIAETDKTDEGNYRVTITNAVSTANSNFVSVIVNIPVEPVSIVMQPESKIVSIGNTANFQVSANGGGFISYQWRKNGIYINNAYSSQLQITDADLIDAGNYDVIISNSRGSMTSQSAQLTVLANEAPVSITQQPTSKTVYISDKINLAVSASGEGTLDYQWFFNGQAILDANQSELIIDQASLSDQGSYSVQVKNDHSSQESLTAFITVKAKPSVQLTWDIPTAREDDSDLELDDINSYIIQYGYSLSEINNQISIPKADTIEHTITELSIGLLYIRIATKDTDGIQGPFTDWFNINIE